MLSHVDDDNRARMVDVSAKEAARRVAKAQAVVYLPPEVLALVEDGEIRGKKGPVFETARIAGVMAAKKTSELIPLCHPLGLEDCQIDIALRDNAAVVTATCVVTHKTGVEMEALTAATVAALTIYDMCKAASHEIVIGDVRLIEKTGGKRDYRAE